MQLDIILFTIFLIFIATLIFFVFNKTRLIKRWQAISICLLGVFIYGSLFGACCYYNFYYGGDIKNKDLLKKEEVKKQVSKKNNKNSTQMKEKSNKRGMIIGDIDSKIYHIPGDAWYERELKKESNNKYFNTVEEAEKAGYRAPKK
ncbi:hypothetical protein ACER0A_000250 [Haloimpatiens sp. FM7315]|uniref:sunset domain-containing protein n=1 Tax=Haloimpatiens sp. FM7315 TaxID=3298609 RepID=UPI0035A2FA90